MRGRYRDGEGDASRLRLLQSAASVLGVEAQQGSALAAVLAQALRFLTADSGLVLGLDGGALVVQACHGPVLPVGARLPVGGVLAAALKPPLQPVLRERLESRLRVGQQPEVAFELLVPLRHAGRAHGLLALLGERSGHLPSAGDLATLQALATFIGSVLAGAAAHKPRPHRREAAASLAQMTPREQQVFALLPRGLTNAEIADELGIATGTVKVHVERLLHKLGVADRTQAAVRATEWGVRT